MIPLYTEPLEIGHWVRAVVNGERSDELSVPDEEIQCVWLVMAQLE